MQRSSRPTEDRPDSGVQTAEGLDRRTVGRWAVGAAAVGWAGLGSAVPSAATQAGSATAWKPKVFDRRQAEMVERLVETLIPTTDTPGAGAAGVHRYIDEALSVESDGQRDRFLEGLDWLRRHARRAAGGRFHKLADEQVIGLLKAISDDAPEDDEDLEPGRRFFRDLKERTIFGYYTSLEGRVEELGYPKGANTSRWVGCQHGAGHGEA